MIDYIKAAESWLKRYTGSFVYNEYSQGVLAFARHLAGQDPQPAKEGCHCNLDEPYASKKCFHHDSSCSLFVDDRKPKEECHGDCHPGATISPSNNSFKCNCDCHKPKEECTHGPSINECIECAVRNYKPKEDTSYLPGGGTCPTCKRPVEENKACCPPHDFVDYHIPGAWSASVPPPNKICLKCLMTITT